MPTGPRGKVWEWGSQQPLQPHCRGTAEPGEDMAATGTQQVHLRAGRNGGLSQGCG